MRSGRYIFLAGTILGFFLVTASHASAQSCSFSVSGMNFGAVDTLSGNNVDSTATLSATCSGAANSTILICPNINQGSGGATASARRMLSGTNVLNYQLYQNAARTTVWGSQTWPYTSLPPALTLTLNASGSGSGQRTIYGRIFGGQTSAVPATYQSNFSGTAARFVYAYNLLGLNCSLGLANVATPTFTVSGSIPGNCRVSAQDIDFGSTGVLDANVDASGQLAVTCTPGTSYSVALNNGNTGTSPTQRRMTLGGAFVSYGLYRDAARSQPWGSSAQSSVSGTGNGASQTLSVYGRVQPQSTPAPGTYTDTVVVTVTY